MENICLLIDVAETLAKIAVIFRSDNPETYKIILSINLSLSLKNTNLLHLLLLSPVVLN